MARINPEIIDNITRQLTYTISETNGISLNHTLELLSNTSLMRDDKLAAKLLDEFKRLLADFQQRVVDINTLLGHPVSGAFFNFFKSFPLTFREEHIHLTGSLTAGFIYPRLKVLLEGKHRKLYEKKIKQVYGEDALPIENEQDVDDLIRLKVGEGFSRYLKILYLAKLVLNSKKAYEEAAYHMAHELYSNYNVGHIRLKFTLSRLTSIEDEVIPGIESLSEEDVIMGLYSGLMRFKKEVPVFNFFLSPCFRKEEDFFDAENYDTKKDHFKKQVATVVDILKLHPELQSHLTEIDTVGDEQDLYRKKHFEEMRAGIRKLQYRGLHIRSHHGETWKNLKKGVQAVENAMNIWHIDTLEHGLSLGINPNFYMHRIFQKVLHLNGQQKPIPVNSLEYNELQNIEWSSGNLGIRDKLLQGTPLTDEEITKFVKDKFHTAREIEHYQHDVLNRMIDKGVSLVSLPTSNMKLTGCIPDYKNHPFTWWEKKGVNLGIGTDNYVTLTTNYIQEMLILLFSDPENLKITKLIMVATGENRRPYISNLLWEMRKKVHSEKF